MILMATIHVMNEASENLLAFLLQNRPIQSFQRLGDAQENAETLPCL